MWLTVLRTAGPYALAAALGFGGAWYWQGLLKSSLRADLAVLQGKVDAANEGARIATEKAQADTASQQGQIDAYKAELAKALAGQVRTVDTVRTVRVRGVCPATDRQDSRAPPDKDSPVDAGAADPTAAPGVYRCFRLDDFTRWRDSVTSERNRLRDGHLAHQALSRALEAATDHIEIVE